MRYRLFLLAALLGVFLLALGATLRWHSDARAALTADPTPVVIATVYMGPSGNTIGVGVNAETNRIYAANWNRYGTPSDVAVIDGSTNTEIDADGNPDNGTTHIPVGSNAYNVAVNPTTNRVYTVNWYSHDVSVIDGGTNTVVATIPVGAHPYGVAVNPMTNRVYAANHGSNDVSVIDGSTNTEIDTDGDPVNGITRISVGTSPWGIAVNPVTNRIYAANYGSSDVSVIDGDTNTVVATIPAGSQPLGIAVNPLTDRIYSGNAGSDDVLVIDGSTNVAITTVLVGSYPRGVAVNTVTNRIYVTRSDGDSLSIIDGGTNTLTGTVAVAGFPVGVAVNPTTNRIYLADQALANVYVLQDFPLPAPVGGIAELPDIAESGSSARNFIALAGAAMAGAIIVAVGGWYASRRRLRG